MNAIKLSATLLMALPLAILTASCGGSDTANPTPTSSATATASATPDASKLPITDPAELHIAAADGSSEKTVFSGFGASYFAWSPDGQGLAEADWGARTSTVRFVGLDGVEHASVTHSGGMSDISFSPDGRFVVSRFGDASGQEIVSIPVDGGGAARDLLTAPINQALYASGWLPSGEVLVILDDGATGKLSAVNPETGAQRAMTDQNVREDYFGRPALSPDGKQLVVTVQTDEAACGYPGPSSNAIWLIDLNTGTGSRVGSRSGLRTGRSWRSPV